MAERFSGVLGSDVTGVILLAENKYCGIHQGTSAGKPVIFKQYKTEDDKLARLEAEGISFYHSIASERETLIDSKVLGYDAAQKIIAISFVPGARLSDFLRSVAGSRDRWAEGVHAMEVLGSFLSEMRSRTKREGEPLDPFHFEYLRYASGRLASLPIVGSVFFRNALIEAEGLIDRISTSGISASMAHGDFVLRNIHIDGAKVGVIDFANTIKASSPLNDLCNLWQGLENMFLPAEFRSLLWEGVARGFGSMPFDEAEEQFFHEYHRRRWLMLNWKTGDPRRWLKAVRGMMTFAKPWESGVGVIAK